MATIFDELAGSLVVDLVLSDALLKEVAAAAEVGLHGPIAGRQSLVASVAASAADVHLVLAHGSIIACFGLGVHTKKVWIWLSLGCTAVRS